MVRVLSFVLLTLTVPTLVPNTGGSTGKGGTTTKALIALEHRWAKAMLSADLAALDDILADSYVDTGEDGERSDKRRSRWVLKSRTLRFETLSLSDMRVFTYGNAAVVVGIARQRGMYQCNPLPARVAFTDTFVRQNGTWRAVASHRSAVP